jgi:hypothetical protein
MLLMNMQPLATPARRLSDQGVFRLRGPAGLGRGMFHLSRCTHDYHETTNEGDESCGKPKNQEQHIISEHVETPCYVGCGRRRVISDSRPVGVQRAEPLATRPALCVVTIPTDVPNRGQKRTYIGRDELVGRRPISAGPRPK